MIDMPWSPRTRQQEGMATEKRLAKKRGLRLHPRSGAGRIKDDASSDDKVVEFKDAYKTHALKGDDLDKLLRRATQQGKDAEYVVYFNGFDLTATIKVQRGQQ